MQNKYIKSKQPNKQMETQLRQTSTNIPNQYFNFPLKDTFQLAKRAFISTSKSRASTDQTKSLDKQNQQYTKIKDKIITPPCQFQYEWCQSEFCFKRLSDQIETQRKKLRDYERQINNANNYEVQIKELNDQCLALQSQNNEYRQQLQKMNDVCQKIYHQNEKLRNKNQINLQNKQLQQQLLYLKIQLENQIKQKQKLKNVTIYKKSEGKQRVYFSENMSDQHKISKLSQQILRLSEVVISKNSIIMNLQDELINFKKQQKVKQQNTVIINQNQKQDIFQIQLKNVQNQLTQKNYQCNNLKNKQKQYFKDLQDINKLRVSCQSQQKQIMQKIKDMQKLRRNHQQTSYLLVEQKLKNVQLTELLRFRNSSIQSGSYSPVSKLSEKSTAAFNHQNIRIQNIIQSIEHYEKIIRSLQTKYNVLLQRVQQANFNAGGDKNNYIDYINSSNTSFSRTNNSRNSSNRGLPITVGESRVQD